MYFKRIIMLVMLRLVFKAISGFMVYIFIDDFLIKEYEEDYTLWKNDNFYSVEGYFETPEEEASEIAEFQRQFSYWGPIAIVISLMGTCCCCGAVLCYFRKY